MGFLSVYNKINTVKLVYISISTSILYIHQRHKKKIFIYMYTQQLCLQDPKAGRRSEYTHTTALPTRPESRSPVRVHTHNSSAYKTRQQVAGQSTHTHTHTTALPTRPESRSPVRVHTHTHNSSAYKTRKQVAGQSTHTYTQQLCLQDPKACRRSEQTCTPSHTHTCRHKSSAYKTRKEITRGTNRNQSDRHTLTFGELK